MTAATINYWLTSLVRGGNQTSDILHRETEQKGSAAYLLVIGAEDNPSTEAVAQVYYPGTADETDNVRERCPESQDEDLEIR